DSASLRAIVSATAGKKPLGSGAEGGLADRFEEKATGMPTNKSPHANPCRCLTQFDLRRPEGAKCVGSLPWEILGLPGTEFLRVVHEVPPRRSPGFRLLRGVVSSRALPGGAGRHPAALRQVVLVGFDGVRDVQSQVAELLAQGS